MAQATLEADEQGKTAAAQLRVLCVGFIGSPVGGASPATKHAPYLLAVAASSAPASWLEVSDGEPVMTYTCGRTQHTDIMLALPGAVAGMRD